MPIPKITITQAKKMKKVDVIFHCFQLQQFIDLFDFDKLINENEKLKEENEKLKVHNLHYEDCIRTLEEDKKEEREKANNVIDELIEDYNKLKEETDKLKELF